MMLQYCQYRTTTCLHSIHLSLGDEWNKEFFGTKSTGRAVDLVLLISTFWHSGRYFRLDCVSIYRVDTFSGL
jgi:hypothetical protein